MASICISSCLDDTRVPVRATYVNLYKWPESDAEFVKSVSSNMSKSGCGGRGGHVYRGHPRMLDSISCRQLYLRSYTFSRKESVPKKTVKCLGRVKQRVVVYGKKKTSSGGSGRIRKPRSCVMLRGAKQVPGAALLSVFRRLLFCATKVDVVG